MLFVDYCTTQIHLCCTCFASWSQIDTIRLCLFLFPYKFLVCLESVMFAPFGLLSLIEFLIAFSRSSLLHKVDLAQVLTIFMKLLYMCVELYPWVSFFITERKIMEEVSDCGFFSEEKEWWRENWGGCNYWSVKFGRCQFLPYRNKKSWTTAAIIKNLKCFCTVVVVVPYACRVGPCGIDCAHVTISCHYTLTYFTSCIFSLEVAPLQFLCSCVQCWNEWHSR